MQKITAYLKDETGASAAEYALILAIVGTAIAAAALLLGDTIHNAISSAASDGSEIRDRIEVKVRDKKVVAATLNGAPLERRLWDEYDMPGWLGFVEEFLRLDTKPDAPRTFRVAVFDPQTGALRRFARRVSGTRERQEIRFLLTPNPSGTAAPELRGGQVRPEGE